MQVVDACYYCGASRIKVRIVRSSCCFNVMLSKEEEGETTRAGKILPRKFYLSFNISFYLLKYDAFTNY